MFTLIVEILINPTVVHQYISLPKKIKCNDFTNISYLKLLIIITIIFSNT